MPGKLKCWAISDTHGFHEDLKVPEGIDLAIFAGDCSNFQQRVTNHGEVFKFLKWYNDLKIQYKIFVAGNHDTSIEARMIYPGVEFKTITYLEHEHLTIQVNKDKAVKIFGSPYTPTFGTGWAFNKDRSKLQAYWDEIHEDTDIVVTHGPPVGMLDLSINRDDILQMCGCAALMNRINRIRPKYAIFGHIHNHRRCLNQGVRVFEGVTYINASCVEDGRFDKGATSNGVIFEI